MKIKLLESQKGFTILELLVSSFLGLMMTGIFIGLMQTNRNVLAADIARTTLNQSLRGALDVIGADIRVGGENLSSVFPAIELENGESGSSDVLTVRRNLLDEILPVCVQINSGSAVNNVYFAIAGTAPGCVYSGHTHNFQAWQNYRMAQNGQKTKAYIYNTSTKEGEFFEYAGEIDSGDEYALVKTSGAWQNTYPVGSSAIYIIEEWQYSLEGENLQLIENQDQENAFNVSFSINDFQVQIVMQDGSLRDEFNAGDDWTEIASIRTTLAGSENNRGELINRSLSATFFPRNVLSN